MNTKTTNAENHKIGRRPQDFLSDLSDAQLHLVYPVKIYPLFTNSATLWRPQVASVASVPAALRLCLHFSQASR
jgi:hypothetical protein